MTNQMNDPAETNREETSGGEETFPESNLDELLDARSAMEEMKELSRKVSVYAIKTRYEMSKKRRECTELAPERKRRKINDNDNSNPNLEDVLSIEASDKEHLVRMTRALKNMQATYQTFIQELNIMVEESELEAISQNGVQTERSISLEEQLKPTE